MEYVVMISIITAAVVFMLPRIKRTTQSVIKSAADQIGDQAGAEQDFNSIRGYLVNADMQSNMFVNNIRTDTSGAITQTFSETTETTAISYMNSGWSEE
jgi:hypothetical protein